MKKTILWMLLSGLSLSIVCRAQYDPKYVETKTLYVEGEVYAIEKMHRKDQRVKVKYFSSREGNLSVYQRFKNWSANKNIIAISSGTYMNVCDASVAVPVGLCVDNGNIVNERLEPKMDGLMVVYATGGLVASNLKAGNLKVTINGVDRQLDIRNNAYHKTEFLEWAKSQEATVFQSHLFVYQNQLQITGNSPSDKAPRRFLAVCRSAGNVVYYIINLPTSSTLFQGATKAFNYLDKLEDVEVTFMINLDTGCQDVYKVFDKNGKVVTSQAFKGTLDTSNASNLLVYYYE